MVNKSGNKGTKAEGMFAAYLTEMHWPYAERRSKNGSLDKGDTTGHPGLCFEVKDDKSYAIPAWMRETEAERINSKSDYGILAVKLDGYGKQSVGLWPAYMDADAFAQLLVQAGAIFDANGFETTPRKMKIKTALELLDGYQDRFATARYRTNGDLADYNVMRLGRMITLLNRAGYGTQN